MRFDELGAELREQLREKAQKCETSEERMAFLAESGIELSDEQLKGVSGGVFDTLPRRGRSNESLRV